MKKNIFKAGGIVVKKENDKFYVLLVHRPNHNSDWTFPKGHVDQGELVEEAALREIKEEAGIGCEIVRELDPLIYDNSSGDICSLRFFLMKPIVFGGPLDYECDEIAWLEFEDVLDRLSYDNLREYFKSIKNDLFI